MDFKREFLRLTQNSEFQNGLWKYGKECCVKILKIELHYCILKDSVFSMNQHAYFIQITEIIFQNKHQDVWERNTDIALTYGGYV